LYTFFSMLRCIQRSETDPYYNLAAEEYLLKTATTDTFMTWRDEPSVIVGKHQVTSKEINQDFIESSQLPVIRRISGGGSVYHDLGNVNFSFIYTDRKDNLVDFKQFTKPIILFLKEFGLNANFEEKNNVTVDGLKVSGNSAHVFKNKVLHHGTLLFNSDLGALNKAVRGNEKNYKDKSVSSVPAKVANISSLIKVKLSGDEFLDSMNSFIFKHFPGSYHDRLNDIEIISITKLAEDKYHKIEWNYGYSPDYNYDAEWEMQDGKFKVSLLVSKGQIREAELSGPGNVSELLKRTSNELIGVFHEKKSVSERMKKITFANWVEGQILNEINEHLF
jgi:lipoate---protein ligase